MPIYEFYCPDCHRIFNFFSRRVDTTTQPSCPRCGRKRLDRQVSIFSISRGREQGGEGDLPDIDESAMERVMAELARDADKLDENDPRQMAGLMRKMYDATGLPLGPGMQEAISRMEAGEDPDAIEKEMGDLLEGEGELLGGEGVGGGLKGLRRALPPKVDDELYDL